MLSYRAIISLLSLRPHSMSDPKVTRVYAILLRKGARTTAKPKNLSLSKKIWRVLVFRLTHIYFICFIHSQTTAPIVYDRMLVNL